MAMAAVAWTVAAAGTLKHMPLALQVSSSRASFVPTQLGAHCFRPRRRVQCLTSRPRPRPKWVVFVAQNSAQTEAKETEESEVKEEKEEESSETSAPEPAEEATLSDVQSSLQRFREALDANDEAVLADVEAQLEAIANERDSLGQKVTALIEEVTGAKERFLRLNADFDNYRKRSERDRLAIAGNARGEVIESLLPMVDNFERAKTSIKIETEAEQKIDNSYQGIYKQFVEIMKSLGVVAVDTIGKEFDPNLHEAIMREDSTQYAEGVVTQEFRRGFRIGDRLLRPAMVKVSSGPGPASAAPDLPLEEPLSSE